MKRSADPNTTIQCPKSSQRVRLEPGGTNASEDEDMKPEVPKRVEPVLVYSATAAMSEEEKEAKSESSDSDGTDDEKIAAKETLSNLDGQEENEEPTKPEEEASHQENPDVTADEPLRLSYPRPKNFAERMMNALERGIANDSVWWVGNGKAIGLHPKMLKASPELTGYFKAKDYSGFIRNCNRWGFRRVAHYKVEPGIVTYENSLFQKDSPHLVKHMRMDSDVQDVFARHQSTASKDPGESDADKAARIIAEAKALKGQSRTGRKQRLGAGNQAAAVPSQQASSLPPDLAAAALAALTSSNGQPIDESALSKEFMLRKILQLTDQFLDHPGSLYSDDAAFKTTMQLVRSLGQQHQNDLIAKGHMGTLLRLEASLKPAAAAAPAAATSHQPALSSSQGNTSASPLSSDALQQLLSTQSPSGPAGMDQLQSLLRARAAQTTQQLPQPTQQQAGLASAPSSALLGRLLSGGALAAAAVAQHAAPATSPHMSQALQLLAQQQQQGQQAPQQREPRAALPTGQNQHHDDETPQFTTANELMMRILKQNGSHQS